MADKKATTKKVSKPKKASSKKKVVNKNAKWFVLNTQSGHEPRVAKQIQARIKANSMEKEILDVIVPTQDKIVVKDGKKRTVKEKIYPGYILINMELTDDAWHIVRNTEGVIGFVGTGKHPSPITESEARAILNFMEVKQPTFQSSLSIGDSVKVGEGPFADHVGRVNEINQDRGQVKVLLSFLGRETEVNFELSQVKKI